MADIFAKLSNGYQAFKAGFTGQWSPGEPSKPTAPAGTPPLQYQYPLGYNYHNAPRPDEMITFEQLRALAENYDLLRLAIETRKDQVESLDWGIMPIDRKSKTQATAIKNVEAFFRRPDRHLPFRRWLRAFMEDVLVIDAPAIYIRRTRSGEIYSFDLVDGATIAPKIDASGRRPEPPYPAYQQMIHGMPAVDLTTDELLYMPRNPRTHKVYGFGNVEQIIMTVNIALLRQKNQLGYYTEGNIPEAFIACPDSWHMQQIVEFQAYWDSLFASNSAQRRKARFIPHGTQPIFTKDNPLKDEYDEWLARIISYNFSLPPTALVKETNRATAQTTQEAGKAEGMTPTRNYLKEVMDILIQDYMGYTEIEFGWTEEEINNPLEQAQVNQIYVGMQAITPDEVRAQLGYEPMTEEQKEALQPLMTQPKFSLQPGQEQEIQPAEPEDTKVEKRSKKPAAINPLTKDTPKLRAAQKKAAAVVKAFLDRMASDMADQVKERYAKVAKAEDPKKLVERILAELDFSGWSVLFDDVQPILEEVARYGGVRSLAQVGVGSKNITELVNQDAVTFANKRAAELIGRVWEDGKLVDNPNPAWAITESTRGYLRSNITQAVEEGWSPQKLADHLAENVGFSADRAENIARTEVANAHTQGNLAGWNRSGVVSGKQSLLSGEHDCVDECDLNAAAGVIPLTDLFPSGDDGPPYHPRCTCVVVPVVDDGE